MNRQLTLLISMVLLAVVLLPACKQSSSVVSEKLIQKRKYRGGWFVDVPSRKKRENGNFVQVEENEKESSEVQSEKRINAVLPSQHKITVVPLLRRSSPTVPSRQQETQTNARAPEVDGPAVMDARIGLKELLPDEEEEEAETPLALSMTAKLLAVASGILALVTVIAFFIFLFGSSTLSSTGVIVLAAMAILSVIGILISLLISYIIMEKYGDDVPMQWTLFASYIFQAILAVFLYGVLSF